MRGLGLGGTKVWRSCHDGALLRGLLKYGYGQWQRIVKDPELGIKVQGWEC